MAKRIDNDKIPKNEWILEIDLSFLYFEFEHVMVFEV